MKAKVLIGGEFRLVRSLAKPFAQFTMNRSSFNYLMAAVLGWALACPALAENKVAADLSPTKENPRKSEGDFIQLKSGRILFFYTEFYGGKGDHSPAHIVSIHSDDKGETWSQTPEVIVKNAGEMNVMSVSLLRLKSGRIAFFYIIKNGLHDSRPWVQFSDDEAQTWTKPTLVVDAPGYFVLNNDRVIQLQTGRLVVPVAYHRMKAKSLSNKSPFDGRAVALWYLSDDEGKTWVESDTWWALPMVTKTGLQEPGVVELADGSLFSWARTDQLYQYGCVSTDAGRTWSAPEPTTLRSPVSPATIERIPGSTDLLAVFNDHSGQFPHPGEGKRAPLVAAISKDGGKTWPHRKLIEDDPNGWFCYTAMEFVEDAVLLGYCAGNMSDKSVGGLNRTRIRKVKLDWLRRE